MFRDETVDLNPNLDPDDPRSVLNDSESSHPRLPPKNVTATFKDALDVLQVSKGCCPACNALVGHILSSYKAGMIYPGNHTQGHPISIPSFTEARAVRTVITAARHVLEARFAKILEHMQPQDPKISSLIRRFTCPSSPQQSVDARLYASPSRKRKRVVSLETTGLHSAVAITQEPANTPKISATPKATTPNRLAKLRKSKEKRLRRIKQKEEAADKERLDLAALVLDAKAKGDDADVSMEDIS